MKYYLIRLTLIREPIGILKAPDQVVSWAIYHTYNESAGAYRISEAEYTSYEALELFTVFAYELGIINTASAIFYDPHSFELDGLIMKHRTMKCLNMDEALAALNRLHPYIPDQKVS